MSAATPSGLPPASPVLDVRELTVRYGGVLALDEVTFTVEAATIHGVIGPNGAGKTTLIDTLTGFTTQSSGSIRFAAHSSEHTAVDGMSPQQRARRGLVRTFQSLELFDDLSVRENLFVASTTPTFWSTVTDALWPKRHASREVDDILERVGLAPLADRLPAELSNGERHRVALARALAGRPKLLLLDEPAAGLGPAETAELDDVLRGLPATGVSVLLVDHDMSLVLDICTRITVLDFGRVIADGTPAEVRSDPTVIDAYLGGTAHHDG